VHTQGKGAVQEAAMRLRSHRRDLVVWSLSASPADRHGDSRLTPLRARRIRRLLRIGALITLVGAMRLAQSARYRWRPLLAGAVLVAVGLMLHGSAWGVTAMAGIYFLWYAVLVPGRPEADRQQHSDLEHDLAGYSTAAQRSDFLATLDRYPDEVTRELRDILANQAMAACCSRVPGAGRS
jgi:hypothetical protein